MTLMDLCGLKPQVRQHVPGPSVGIPWTAVDPGKRVGSASGAEGRRFETCRGRHLTSADVNLHNIRVAGCAGVGRRPASRRPRGPQINRGFGGQRTLASQQILGEAASAAKPLMAALPMQARQNGEGEMDPHFVKLAIFLVIILIAGATTAAIAQKKNLPKKDLPVASSFGHGAALSLKALVNALVQKPGLPTPPPGMRAVQCPGCNTAQHIPESQPAYECSQCKNSQRPWGDERQTPA